MKNFDKDKYIGEISQTLNRIPILCQKFSTTPFFVLIPFCNLFHFFLLVLLKKFEIIYSKVAVVALLKTYTINTRERKTLS